MNNMENLSILVGKTIESIEQPTTLMVGKSKRDADNIVIKFTDGTVLKLVSWDCEGYKSSIYKEIVITGK